VAASSSNRLLDGSQSGRHPAAQNSLAMQRIWTAGLLPAGRNFGCPLMKEKNTISLLVYNIDFFQKSKKQRLRITKMQAMLQKY
jgi:hypothetical protein